MCITLPGRVLTVAEGRAVIDLLGKTKEIRIFDAQVSAGDWVLSTDEYLVKKITGEEAAEIAGLFDYYPSTEAENPELKKILAAALTGRLTTKEIEFLLDLKSEADLRALFSQANVIRLSQALNHICVHGIIEFSNFCKNNCHYCGLRCDNSVKRYRLSDDELIRTAVAAVNDKGYKILVLQSGEDDYYDLEKLKQIVAEIKRQARAFIYLSIGERPIEDYQELKKAGAGGVLFRFETSNQELYHEFRPNKELKDRLDLLRQLKDNGYVLATGFLIGLPKQKMSDLAQDLLMLADLAPFMPSIGPLVPSKGTPLASSFKVDKNLVLKVIAIIRLLLPNARIPITTAMETLYGENFRQEAFLAGANSVMLNLTPAQSRDDYYIYEDKFFDEEKKFEKWALFKGDLSYQMLEQELKTQI